MALPQQSTPLSTQAPLRSGQTLLPSGQSQALKNLVSSFPVANQQVANQLDAQRQTQMAQSIAQTPNTLASTRPAAALGAQSVAQQGQNQLQLASQNQNDQVQVGQLALAQQAQQNRAQVFQQQTSNQQTYSKLAQQLAQLDSRTKTELLDKQLQFQHDDAGRTLLTDQQIMDYAVVKARNQEQFQQYAQWSQQATKRELMTLQTAYDKMATALQEHSAEVEQGLDQASKLKITQNLYALKQQLARKQAEAANKQAMWQAGGSVVGAVAGGVIGSLVAPGVGTAAGATLGSSVGGAVGTLGGQA